MRRSSAPPARILSQSSRRFVEDAAARAQRARSSQRSSTSRANRSDSTPRRVTDPLAPDRAIVRVLLARGNPLATARQIGHTVYIDMNTVLTISQADARPMYLQIVEQI